MQAEEQHGNVLFRNSTMCKRCSRELPQGALVCSQCHALVHGDELEQLSTSARALEGRSERQQARNEWLRALELLPEGSSQAEWVRSRARALDSGNAVGAGSGAAEPHYKWARKLGPLAPLAVILAKGKALLSLFKLKFLLSLAAFVGVYWTLYGPRFGLGFVALIVIHEMGHFIDVKRRRLPAEMPVFLPGLGAYVRWQALGVTTETRAAVSLAGPLAGFAAAAGCVVLWRATGDALWAALARAGAWLNALNLIPVWVLDGGQAILPMNKAERLMLLAAALVLWIWLREGVFFLVAAGAAYRLFTRDMPAEGSRVTAAYFLGVLASLGLVMWITPGAGWGAR